MESKTIHRSIELLNRMFIVLIVIDIIVCLIFEDQLHLYSSLILISGLVMSQFLFRWDCYECGTIGIAVTFYCVGMFQVAFLDSHSTCYFILLIVPLVASLILNRMMNKIILLCASCILFIRCNHIAGFHLLENYFFFYGLIPTTIMMLFFYNELEKATIQKNLLIEELRGKNEEIMLYSNMMSHDLKAPLRNIEGFSGILLRNCKQLDERNRELLNFIVKGTKSMKNLIDDLLDYSRSNFEQYTFKQLDLNKLMDKILLSFNYEIEKGNISINKKGLDMVYGHEESLSLVFQNLISNSIKYQPKVSAHLPQIDISCEANDDRMIIKFRDNGIGLDDEEAKSMFLPFTRFHSESEYEGTGMGLSIVSKIIEKHSGSISVESQINKGTTFTISLPLYQDAHQIQS